MTPAEFYKSTASPEPVYLLITEQDYIKRRVLEHCRNQVEEGSRAFNWAVFDFEEDSYARFLNTARTLPWMAPRRWIFVQNAGGEEKLLDYVRNPSSHATVILEMRKRPSRWPVLPSIEVADANPLRWVIAKARREGYEMDGAAAQALVELVGDDFQRLDSELEKQFLYRLETRRITLESILDTAVQAREYEVFALVDTIARHDSRQALQILSRLAQAGVGPPLVISILYSNFRRLLVAQEMLGRGRPFSAVLKETNLWSYKNRQEEVRAYSRNFLVGMLLQLKAADRICKTTSTSSKLLLERLILQAAGDEGDKRGKPGFDAPSRSSIY